MKKYLLLNRSHTLLFLSFVLMNIFVYIAIGINVDQRVDARMQTHLEKLQTHYDIFLENQKVAADTIHKTTVKNKKVIGIIDKALKSDNKSEIDSLRGDLYDILKERYGLIKESGVLQYQFVFPDNKVFLRMHKPDKFGDDLSKVRFDFKRANETKQIVRGFSKGRTAHGLRNVYPLFNDKNEHLGVMEVSFPTELLQEKLNKISKIYSHFLVNRKIIDTKKWSRDDDIINYKPSIEHGNYLLTFSKEHDSFEAIEDFKMRIYLLKDKINKKINNSEKFTVLSDYKNSYVVCSFLPIKNSVNNETAAYLVSYEKDDYIKTTIQDSILIYITSFILLSIITYFVYSLIKHRNSLASLLCSYDQNVIFSKTDKKGIITHVSEAFCKISGYSKEELIGKPHNIVRHPDMPKESFKYLWDELKKGHKVSLEVKNLKKNGDYYWVDAEIEPEYKNGKLLGYTAIRQDITHMKDVEEIQKEIIFNMGSIGESRSKETGNHVKRVAEYSKVLALKYGLEEDESEMLRQASPMHDIGKVAIPDSILNKPGRLTDEEMQIMQTHVVKGFEMLNVSDRPLLKTAAVIALEHHEKWDGTGYPSGKKAEDIHIYGRITALADVFDALGSDRCYKKAWDDEKIFNMFKEERGRHFDPALVDIFFENLNEFLRIREQFKDT